jgi:2-(1,2-epoxy-1,2-dihydrophenyl)acetyl-CoA isomerase
VPDLIETVENGISTLTLNRPERLNALSIDIRTGLIEALERLGQDNSVACIVLTGAGRGFCVGGDVKSMGERSAAGFEPRAAGIQLSNRIPS